MVKRPDAFTGAHEQSHIQLATFTPKTAKLTKQEGEYFVRRRPPRKYQPCPYGVYQRIGGQNIRVTSFTNKEAAESFAWIRNGRPSVVARVKKHARLLNGLRGLAVWLDGMGAEHNAKLVRRAMEIINGQSL